MEAELCDYWIKSFNPASKSTDVFCSIEALKKKNPKQSSKYIQIDEELEYHSHDKFKYSNLAS